MAYQRAIRTFLVEPDRDQGLAAHLALFPHAVRATTRYENRTLRYTWARDARGQICGAECNVDGEPWWNDTLPPVIQFARDMWPTPIPLEIALSQLAFLDLPDWRRTSALLDAHKVSCKNISLYGTVPQIAAILDVLADDRGPQLAINMSLDCTACEAENECQSTDWEHLFGRLANLPPRLSLSVLSLVGESLFDLAEVMFHGSDAIRRFSTVRIDFVAGMNGEVWRMPPSLPVSLNRQDPLARTHTINYVLTLDAGEAPGDPIEPVLIAQSLIQPNWINFMARICLLLGGVDGSYTVSVQRYHHLPPEARDLECLLSTMLVNAVRSISGQTANGPGWEQLPKADE